MSVTRPLPVPTLKVRAHTAADGRLTVHYEALFRWQERKVWKRIGPAWLEPDGVGGWRKRKGRMPDGFFSEASAHVRAAELVREYVADALRGERVEAERLAAPITFRRVADDYMAWLEREDRAKPATLANYRYMLAEPGTRWRRGAGSAPAYIISALGERPAAEITPGEVRLLLDRIAATGAAPATVNRHRALISTIFTYGVRRANGYRLERNPVLEVEPRREAGPAPLTFYSVEQVEAAARAMHDGLHRRPLRQRLVTDAERARWAAEDARDAEAVRVSAYCGLRQGELLALRWADVDWAGSKLTVSRALSARNVTATKSRRVRTVPLSDQAGAALARLAQRTDFTAPGEYVFCDLAHGRLLDGSALRRRFKAATAAAGLPVLRWHDLRHTFGSLLVVGGLDLVTVQSALGHSRITTTSRYLHARPAHEQAAAFTTAFTPAAPATPLVGDSAVRTGAAS